MKRARSNQTNYMSRGDLNPGTPEYRNTYKKTFFVTYL